MSATQCAVVLTYQKHDAVNNKYIPNDGLTVQLRDFSDTLAYELNESPEDSGYYRHATIAPGVYYIWDDTSGALGNSGRKLIVGAVSEDAILDGAVTANKIAPASIFSNKIVDGNITRVKIADEAVDSSKIEDEAVNAEKLADGAVEEEKIRDSAITSFKIADKAVTNDKIDFNEITYDRLSQALKDKISAIEALLRTLIDDNYEEENIKVDLDTGSHTNTIYSKQGLQIEDLNTSLDGEYDAPTINVDDNVSISKAYLLGEYNLPSGTAIKFEISIDSGAYTEVALGQDIGASLQSASPVDLDIRISLTGALEDLYTPTLNFLNLTIVRPT